MVRFLLAALLTFAAFFRAPAALADAACEAGDLKQGPNCFKVVEKGGTDEEPNDSWKVYRAGEPSKTILTTWGTDVVESTDTTVSVRQLWRTRMGGYMRVIKVYSWNGSNFAESGERSED